MHNILFMKFYAFTKEKWSIPFTQIHYNIYILTMVGHTKISIFHFVQKWDQLNDELKHRRTTVMSLEREIPFELIEEDDMVEIADKIDKLQLIQKRISELESGKQYCLNYIAA